MIFFVSFSFCFLFFFLLARNALVIPEVHSVVFEEADSKREIVKKKQKSLVREHQFLSLREWSFSPIFSSGCLFFLALRTSNSSTTPPWDPHYSIPTFFTSSKGIVLFDKKIITVQNFLRNGPFPQFIVQKQPDHRKQFSDLFFFFFLSNQIVCIAVFNQNVCGFFVRIFFLALPLFLGPFRAPDNPVVFLVCSWWWAS